MSNVRFDFSGQFFLVTGVSSGIGAEVAAELLQAGAVVLGIARHTALAVQRFRSFGERFVPAELDVTDTKAMESALQGFCAAHGRLSGFVHCAGMTELMPLRVWRTEPARQIMEVNLWAGVELLKLASRKRYVMPAASHVFVSSVSAQRGQMALAAYSASKGALEAMVRCVSLELAGRQQRVNSVCLGWIEGTRMTTEKLAGSSFAAPPLGQGVPADAAGAVLFLLSDRTRWMTGTNLVMDGGYLA